MSTNQSLGSTFKDGSAFKVLSQASNFYFHFFSPQRYCWLVLQQQGGWCSYEGFPKQERVRSPFESAVARVTSFLAFQISLLFSFFLCRVWVRVPGGFPFPLSCAMFERTWCNDPSLWVPWNCLVKGAQALQFSDAPLQGWARVRSLGGATFLFLIGHF